MRALLGMLLLLLLAIRAWNGPDETPSPSAQRWGADWTNEVADADNAWLWLAGLGAAADDSPFALARRRLDAYEALRAAGPGGGREEALRALLVDPLPLEADYLQRDALAGCPRRDISCAEWAGRHLHGLDTLAQSAQARLQRYEHALTLEAYEESARPSLLDHRLDYGARTAYLHLDLLAAELARGAAPAQVVERLQAVQRFWRRVGTRGRSAASKLLALQVVEHSAWLSLDALDYTARGERGALAPALRSLVQPPDAAMRDLAPELRHRAQSFEHAMAQQFGVAGLARGCVTKPGDCLQNVVMMQAYSPQATLNLVAATNDILDHLQAATPETFASTLATEGASFTRLHPVLDGDFLQPFRQRNPTGRILAAIAVPDAQWVMRRNDQETLLRLLALRQQATLQGIDGARMSAFLSRQPASLRDPYSGAPFTWDAFRREMHFAPAAAYWNRAALRVALPPEERPGIERCARPLSIDVRRRLDTKLTVAVARGVACGAFDVGELTTVEHQQTDEYDRDDPAGRFEHAWLGVREDAVALRVLHRDDDGRLLASELLTLPADGAYRVLAAAGHDDGDVLEARARPSDGRHLRILVRDRSVVEIVRGVEREMGITVTDLPVTCAANTVTMNFSQIALHELLSLLADECGRWLQPVDADTYRLRADAPPPET